MPRRAAPLVSRSRCRLATLTRVRRASSLDLRNNPGLCGMAALRTVAVPADWKGFCQHAFTEDNSDCSVLTAGTNVGKLASC